MQIPEKLRLLGDRAERELSEVFKYIDSVASANTEKVLDAFREERVSEAMLHDSTGYGYGDAGRDAIDRIAAKVFGADAGFMRPAIICGTHALTIALFGLLRPGDTLLSVTGAPYDTLGDVIGTTGKSGDGSLADFGVKYREVPLKDGDVDMSAVISALECAGDSLKVVFIQRSKGYLGRKTLSVAEIGNITKAVRERAKRDVFVVVDNCYGEFCETSEPASAGVDLIVGSLIKNPGGGMADTGGYIVGTPRAVELCGYRLCSPGIGTEAGASLGQNRNMLRGLFMAPHVVAQALKTAHFAAYVFSSLGYEVSPSLFEKRYDIIQTVSLKTPEGLVGFCGGIQSASPVDSYVSPEPWAMPGYADPVVMAAGAFVGGSSIELSADGPLRPPYTAFLQGGLTFEAGKLGILAAAARCEAAKNK
ncbi:MAG: methionine gamma-lyase family protein [Clostridia bacterium]|nr:methionine gamma-lyase family protein [Clostridia bacterium]